MRITHLLIALATLGLAGCVVSYDSDEEVQGRRVSANTLKQFEVGKTTKEWTLAVLGEPSHRETLSTGEEILRYEYSRRRQQDTVVFLLFAGDSDRRERQTVFLEFKDDRLTRHWVETE